MAKKDDKALEEAQDYYKQQTKNEFAFRQMLKTVKPDLYVIFDLLEQTKINFFIIIKVIRQLQLLSKDSGSGGWGKIIIEIQNHRVTFIRGEEAERLDEPLNIKRST